MNIEGTTLEELNNNRDVTLIVLELMTSTVSYLVYLNILNTRSNIPDVINESKIGTLISFLGDSVLE